MSLLTTVRGLLWSPEQESRRTDAALRDLLRGFLDRAARLELTAERAPSEASEAELRRLAADHRRTGELVRQALLDRAASVPGDSIAAPPAVGVSHWARSVEDLAVMQRGHAELLDAAATLGEGHPELAPLFDALIRATAEHITRLRGQIARADPQARN